MAAQPSGWWESLPTPVKVSLLWRLDPWSRPEQRIPDHRWRTCGLTAGRGWGKSRTIARYIHARVMGGRESHIALMAPSEDRADEVQLKPLIEYAPPWERPKAKAGGLVWPNGVRAVVFTPESKSARGDNFSLSWCSEIVDWKPSTREDAFKNLATATRIGEQRILWDSTAKGRNEVRAMLEDLHARDPVEHVIIPGTMFDNPLRSTAYLRGQWLSYAGVRREEELFGASFRESAGALWKQAWLDATRVTTAPELESWIVTVDPALSSHESADETGIIAGGRARDGHVYVVEDASGKLGFDEWGDRAIDLAHPRRPGAGKIGIERKRIGEGAFGNLKARADTRKLRIKSIGKDEPWPAWDPGCIFVREYSPQETKGTRAEGPAAETEAGRVHLVDPGWPDAPRFADLERELVTYVPGTTKRSPNRLDAFAYVVTELRELRLDSPLDHAREAAAAAALNAALNERLRAGSPLPGRVVSTLAGGVVPGGRRMGL